MNKKKKPRTLIVLLMLLKEYMIRISDEDGLMHPPGMCSAIFNLRFKVYSDPNLSLFEISSEERDMLQKCIDDSAPFRKKLKSLVTGNNIGYYFKRNESAPRIKWVEKRLKELKELNK